MDIFNLPRPAIGLSPMDGVTDAAFRAVVTEIGHPDLIYTEFVNVEGLARGAVSLLRHFQYQDVERPIFAQLYGCDPASFRTAAQIAAALGFDGVDINMGCPAKKVAHRGAGAGLIRTPDLAAAIVAAVKQGIADWTNGLSLDQIATTAKMRRALAALPRPASRDGDERERRPIPVSVKTRLGWDTSVIEDWAGWLAEQDLFAISIHGRTLKQAYGGAADWEELARGFRAIRRVAPQTLCLGNGDVTSRADGLRRCREYNADGVLIGRAALGNPWVFIDREPTAADRINLAIRHAYRYEQLAGPAAWPAYRRHLAAYIKGLPESAALRRELMQAQNAAAVSALLLPRLPA